MTITNTEVKARLLEELALPWLSSPDDEDAIGTRSIKRYWPGILEEDFDTARAFLRKWTSVKNYTNDSSAEAHTVTGPMVGGKAVLGTFVFAGVSAERISDEDQDEPVKIILMETLAKVADDTASSGSSGTGTSDSYKDDAFESDRMVQHSGQASALSDSLATAQVVGQIIAVGNKLDNATGLFKTQLNTKLAHIGETPDHVVTVRHDGLTISDRDVKHINPAISPPAWTAAPTVAVALNGIRIERSLNSFGGQAVSKKTLTQAEVALTEITWSVEEGTVYLKRFFGVTTTNLPARMETYLSKIATHHISGTPTFDAETGTWDVVLLAYPKPTSYSQSGGSTKVFDTTWTSFEWRQKQNSAGLVLTRREQYLCGIIQSKSETTTQAFINNKGNAEINALGKWGFRGTFKNLVALSEFQETETGVTLVPT